MPTYFAAQVLPVHLVDLIIKHVISVAPKTCNNRRLRPQIEMLHQQTELLHILVPLLQVCRSWRPSACAQFYSKVTIALVNASYSSEYITIPAQYAKMNSCEQFVRHVNIIVEIGNFVNDWNVNHNNMVSIVRECGPYRLAKTIVCILISKNSASTHIRTGSSNLDQIYAASNIPKNVKLFAAAVHGITSRSCHVHTLGYVQDSSSYHLSDIERMAVNHLVEITRICPKLLLWINREVTEKLLASPATKSLQSIALCLNEDHVPETTLIQRNASTLEKIDIMLATPQACLQLVWCHSQPLKQVNYPHLKYLSLRTAFIEDGVIHPQPMTTPFPQLETLICHDKLPFTESTILNGCRTTLRYIDIELNANVLKILDHNNVLGKGTFKALQHVSFNLYESPDVDGYAFYPIFLKVARLSNCMHTLDIYWIDLNIDFQHLPQTCLSQSLRCLYIRSPHFTIDQVICILGACPQVYKAMLSLTDSFQAAVEYTSELEPEVYQEKYRNCTACAKYLRIGSLIFDTAIQGANAVVLLADIISSITHVSLNSNDFTIKHILYGIDVARKIPAYKGHSRLDGVHFYASKYW